MGTVGSALSPLDTDVKVLGDTNNYLILPTPSQPLTPVSYHELSTPSGFLHYSSNLIWEPWDLESVRTCFGPSNPETCLVCVSPSCLWLARESTLRRDKHKCGESAVLGGLCQEGQELTPLLPLAGPYLVILWLQDPTGLLPGCEMTS